MTLVRGQLAGSSGGYLYNGSVSAASPSADYTAD